MNLPLSSEQKMLQESISKYIADNCSLTNRLDQASGHSYFSPGLKSLPQMHLQFRGYHRIQNRQKRLEYVWPITM